MQYSPLNQWLQRFMLIVLLGVLIFGSGQPAIAESPSMGGIVVPGDGTEPTVTLETRVDQFLQNIPPGFYGVRDVAQIKAKVAEGKTLFIDVREPSEYAGGHIPGAISIPLRELAQHLDQVPHDQPVMLYCSTGYRTGIGVMALRLLGYDNVEGYPPSYVGWQQAQ